MKRIALLTGIGGQDGYWLSKLLLDLEYEVHGTLRRHDPGFLRYLPLEQFNKIILHYADVTDKFAIDAVIKQVKPQEVYHLAAFSSVRDSWVNPELTIAANVNGTLNVLESLCHVNPDTRLFFPGSSEMFGDPVETPQTMDTPFHPISPYGIAKLAAYNLCRSYRDAYKLKVHLAIPYNHESPYRSAEFVMRKIAKAAAAVSKGSKEILNLGDLNAVRDFSHAADLVKGYWQMMQFPEPQECLFASGEPHTIREVCETAFAAVGIQILWNKKASAVSEVGVDTKTLQPLIKVSYEQFRPARNHLILCGDPTQTEKQLGWIRNRKFSQIIDEMVQFDLKE